MNRKKGTVMPSIDTTLVKNTMRYKKFILDRSYAHSQFDKDSCIEWLGKLDERGRPVIKVDGAEITVRAAIYMQRSNRVFAGNMDFEVTCDNPICVNPLHFTYKSTGAPIFRSIAVQNAPTPSPTNVVVTPLAQRVREQPHLLSAQSESLVK